MPAPCIPHPVNRLEAQAGDIIFTPGGGLFGAAIRLGTRSRWGHTGIIEQKLEDGTWVTHEARARGYVRRLRDPDDELVSVWRFPGFSERIVLASLFLVGLELKYEWGNIFRHALYSLFRIRLPLKDNGDRVICSEATALALEGAGAMVLPRPAYEISPGDLRLECELLAAGYRKATV